MSRRKLFTSESAPVVGGFLGAIESVESSVVDVQSPARRKLGRTAEALEKLEQESRENGFADGFEAGRLEGFQSVQRQANAEKDEAIARFSAVLEQKMAQVEQAVQQWYANSEQQLAELSTAIAKQILGQELQLPHDTISLIVRTALAEVTGTGSVRVRINPFESADLLAKRDELLAAFSHIRSIEVVEDPSLFGGCILESDGGRVDASIDIQLELIDQSIREAA